MINHNDGIPQEPHSEDEPDQDRQVSADPIEVTPDGTILDGHHRYPAAQLLGYPTVPVVVRQLD